MAGAPTTSAVIPYKAIFRVLAAVIVVGALLYLFYMLRKPLGWLAAACFIAVAVNPPIRRLSRYMGRGLAIVLVYLIGLVAIPIGLGAIIIPPIVDEVTELANNLPNYARDVSDFIDKNKTLRDLDAQYDISGTLEQQADSVPARIGDAAKVLSDIGIGLIGSIFAAVNIIILSIFILLGGARWRDALIRTRPEAERERLYRVLQRIAAAIGGYVQGALLIALIAGMQTFIVLTILGVPFAAPLAVLAGLASLIPLVGATIAAVLIGVVTLFTHFPVATVVWIVWAIVYQQVENNVIQPQIQRRTVQVEPFVTIVAVIFGSSLLGITGALVAIPAAAAIQIIVNEWADWRSEQRRALSADSDEEVLHEGPEPPPPEMLEPAG